MAKRNDPKSVEERIQKDYPFISLDHTTYKNRLTKCRWVDSQYGDGRGLLAMGFKHIGTTLGFRWTDYQYTFNRLKCRANMDHRRLSEREYAQELGWHKIYDAGQAKFAKTISRDSLTDLRRC